MKITNDPYKYEGQDGDSHHSVPSEEVSAAWAKATDPRLAAEEVARMEFWAAANAARVPTRVIDEEGVWITENRVPAGWSLNGATSEAAHIRARCPWVAEAAAAAYAEECNAAKAARAFEIAEKNLPEAGRSDRVKALPAGVRAELPKWLRRLA